MPLSVLGTGAQCATLSPLQRVRRPATGSYTACRMDFVFPRRRLTYLCRKPRAFSLVAAYAARQGKTAAVTVVSDQTGH